MVLTITHSIKKPSIELICVVYVTLLVIIEENSYKTGRPISEVIVLFFLFFRGRRRKCALLYKCGGTLHRSVHHNPSADWSPTTKCGHGFFFVVVVVSWLARKKKNKKSSTQKNKNFTE